MVSFRPVGKFHPCDWELHDQGANVFFKPVQGNTETSPVPMTCNRESRQLTNRLWLCSVEAELVGSPPFATACLFGGPPPFESCPGINLC